MTDTPTDSDTAARARALLDAATPGPWHVGTDDSAGKDSLMLVCDYDDGSWREGYTGPFYLDPFTYDPTPMERATAELIAAAPTLITDLLAEVDRLTAECRHLGTKMTGDTATDLRMVYAYEAGLAEGEAERDAAAAVSPPPAPTCPTCDATDPHARRVPGSPPCPNPWHQQAT